MISKEPSESPFSLQLFEFRKLEEAIAAAPAGKNGTLNKNIKAMWFGVGDRCSTSRQEWKVKQEHQGHVVYALFVKVKQEHQGLVVYALFVTLKSKFVTLKSKEFNDPFTNKGTVHFVDKTSFKANLNQHAQDTQFMFIIVKHFILPAVETEKDNIEYWAKVFFMDCKTRKQLHLLYQNDLAALPEDELAAVTWNQYLLNSCCYMESILVEEPCVDRLIDDYGTVGKCRLPSKRVKQSTWEGKYAVVCASWK